jgi:hypothetical protein
MFRGIFSSVDMVKVEFDVANDGRYSRDFGVEDDSVHVKHFAKHRVFT